MAIYEKGFCEMNRKTPEEKKAAAKGATALEKNRLGELYPKAGSESTLKLFIGEVLLFGNWQRKEFWEFFEALLVQFYQASPHNPPKRHLTRPGTANVS